MCATAVHEMSHGLCSHLSLDVWRLSGPFGFKVATKLDWISDIQGWTPDPIRGRSALVALSRIERMWFLFRRSPPNWRLPHSQWNWTGLQTVSRVSKKYHWKGCTMSATRKDRFADAAEKIAVAERAI